MDFWSGRQGPHGSAHHTHLLQKTPHHARGVPGAGNEVDAAGVQCKAGHYICIGRGGHEKMLSPPRPSSKPHSTSACLVLQGTRAAHTEVSA